MTRVTEVSSVRERGGEIFVIHSRDQWTSLTEQKTSSISAAPLMLTEGARLCV